MCKTMILPVVLYECETWSLALREEHTSRLRVRMHESRMLRRIFGPKGDKVTGRWKNFLMTSFITRTSWQV
jgi:hypothetical protein